MSAHPFNTYASFHAASGGGGREIPAAVARACAPLTEVVRVSHRSVHTLTWGRDASESVG